MTMSTTLPTVDIETAAEKSYDILCVGFGIIGSVLAFSLANRGRKILIVERDLSPPDRAVGEALQAGGCKLLYELGMGDVLEDESLDPQDFIGYKILYGSNVKSAITGHYPKNLKGATFYHEKFVPLLRMKAASHPNVDVVQATAKSLVRDTHSGAVVGVMATSRTHKNDTEEQGSEKISHTLQLSAKLHIIADGTSSNFRREFTDKKPIVDSYLVALVLEDAVLPSPSWGYIFIRPESADNNYTSESKYKLGPVALYQLSSRDTRMYVDVQGKAPSGKELKSVLEHSVTPNIPACLVPSFLETINSPDPKRRPRCLPASRLTGIAHFREAHGKGNVSEFISTIFAHSFDHDNLYHEGVLLLGDSLNIRHPLSGGGMTVAINDCKILSELLAADSKSCINLENWNEIQDALEIWWKQRRGVASCINTLAYAFYSLLAASDSNLIRLRDGVLAYIRQSDERGYIFTSLVSGLIPSTYLLFNMLAFSTGYSVYYLFLDASSYLSYPLLVFEAVQMLTVAIFTFAPFIWGEFTN